MQYISLFKGEWRFKGHRDVTDAIIDARDFTVIMFNNQGNGVQGKQMGHGRSLHPAVDPVKVVGSRVNYLRRHREHANTPLCAVKQGVSWRLIRSDEITRYLRAAARAIGHRHGVAPKDIYRRSMRSGGAMALLSAGIGGKRIKILGLWRLDNIMRYLHTKARPLLHGFAGKVVEHVD